MRLSRLPILLALATFSLTLSACRTSRSDPVPEVAIGDEADDLGDDIDGEGIPLDADAGPAVTRGSTAAGFGCVADSDCASGRCEAGTCAPSESDCSPLPIVYFAFDQAEISPEETESLRLLARCIRDHRSMSSLSIEGFADERGASEYNVALSYKRAQSVRAGLTSEGVAVPMKVVAWGESFPAAHGHDEVSWSQNRRAVATPAGQVLADGRRRAGR